MKKKLVKYGKILLALTLIGALALPSYATVGASDGSAFVTKAEFDAALSDFNARLTTFEAGINSKIDSQVSSYLDRNGIWNGKKLIPENKTIDGADYGVCVMWWNPTVDDANKRIYKLVGKSGYGTTGQFDFFWQQQSSTYRINTSVTPYMDGQTFCSNVQKSGMYVGDFGVMPLQISVSNLDNSANAFNTSCVIGFSGSTSRNSYRSTMNSLKKFSDIQLTSTNGINKGTGYLIAGFMPTDPDQSVSSFPQWTNTCVEASYVGRTKEPLSVVNQSGDAKLTFETNDFYAARGDLITGKLIQPYAAAWPMRRIRAQFFVSKGEKLSIKPVIFEDYVYTSNVPFALTWCWAGDASSTLGYVVFIRDAEIY